MSIDMLSGSPVFVDAIITDEQNELLFPHFSSHGSLKLTREPEKTVETRIPNDDWLDMLSWQSDDSWSSFESDSDFEFEVDEEDVVYLNK